MTQSTRRHSIEGDIVKMVDKGWKKIEAKQLERRREMDKQITFEWKEVHGQLVRVAI